MPIVNLTGNTQQVIDQTASPTTRYLYAGFTVREATGNNRAIIRLFDGYDGLANMLILDEIALAPGESAREMYYYPYILLQKGMYAVVTGTVAGSVRWFNG